MRPAATEYVVAPDVTLRGQRWQGDLLSVLLIHEPGAGRDLDLWRPLIPYLIGNGATVVALDLRGHGASDGEWEPELAASDLATVATEVRGQGAERVVLCAARESGIAAVRAAELGPIDGLVMLSPSGFDGNPPRGRGGPKLLIRGGSDDSKATTDTLRSSMIGRTMIVTVPSAESGTELLAGDSAITCREHILALLNEVRMEKSNRSSPDKFLELLGIQKRGARE